MEQVMADCPSISQSTAYNHHGWMDNHYKDQLTVS